MSPDLDARERACVEQVLSSARLAYVAMVESSGNSAGGQPDAPRPDDSRPDVRPYVTPMNFVYEPPTASIASGAPSAEHVTHARTGPEGRLLLHTGPGRKVDALAVSPYVCVSVTEQEELHLGDTPCEDGYLYQSAILEGRAELLTDEAEREAALRAIVVKYDPDAADTPLDPRIFAQTLLYAVYIDVIGFKERPKRA